MRSQVATHLPFRPPDREGHHAGAGGEGIIWPIAGRWQEGAIFDAEDDQPGGNEISTSRFLPASFVSSSLTGHTHTHTSHTSAQSEVEGEKHLKARHGMPCRRRVRE